MKKKKRRKRKRGRNVVDDNARVKKKRKLEEPNVDESLAIETEDITVDVPHVKKKTRKLEEPKVDESLAIEIEDTTVVVPRVKKRKKKKPKIKKVDKVKKPPVKIDIYKKYKPVNFECYKEDDKTSIKITKYLHTDTSNSDINGLNFQLCYNTFIISHLKTDIGDFVIFYEITGNNVISVKFITSPKGLNIDVYKYHILVFLEKCCEANNRRLHLFSNNVNRKYYIEGKDKYIIKKSETRYNVNMVY